MHGLDAEFQRLTGTTGVSSCYTGPAANPGEGRLIFTATTPDGHPLPGGWTVIFEYALSNTPPLQDSPKPDRVEHTWARAWHQLAAFEESSPQFASTLAQITRQFTHRGGPNGVPLNQVRTSEAAFGPDREFRQFTLEKGRFVAAPLNQTPAPAFGRRGGREHDALAAFLHERDLLIRSGIHNLPTSIATRRGPVPLLAAVATIPATQPDFHWVGDRSVTSDARRFYSLSTCNGCHAGETGCRDGLHVHPRESGVASQLSAFLRMDHQALRVPDPAHQGGKMEFHEMDDRATIFAALLEDNQRARLNDLRDILSSRLRRGH